MCINTYIFNNKYICIFVYIYKYIYIYIHTYDVTDWVYVGGPYQFSKMSCRVNVILPVVCWPYLGFWITCCDKAKALLWLQCHVQFAGKGRGGPWRPHRCTERALMHLHLAWLAPHLRSGVEKQNVSRQGPESNKDLSCSEEKICLCRILAWDNDLAMVNQEENHVDKILGEDFPMH